MPFAFRTHHRPLTAHVLDDPAIVHVFPIAGQPFHLRSGPGLAFAVIDRLAPGGELRVDGQVTDNDGFVWWRADSGDRWVRSDIVTVVEGECRNLPTINA